MMVFYTRSANEAKRLARAVQTLTGQYTAPVLTADGRYRLQNESYGPEWGVALESLLRHNVRANYCTPERVSVELERLVRQGKVQRSPEQLNGSGHSLMSASAGPLTEALVPATPNLPPTAIAALAAARQASRAPVAIPMGGGAILERESEPPAVPMAPEPLTIPLPDALPSVPRRTVAEFAKHYGVALRSPRRDPDAGEGWKCDLAFVEEAEDETIFPARCTKHMTCFIPTAGPAPTVADALRYLRDQGRDLERHGEKFEGWCARHGFSTDSRTAERGWQRARRHLRDLRGFLGMQLLRELCAAAD